MSNDDDRRDYDYWRNYDLDRQDAEKATEQEIRTTRAILDASGTSYPTSSSVPTISSPQKQKLLMGIIEKQSKLREEIEKSSSKASPEEKRHILDTYNKIDVQNPNAKEQFHLLLNVMMQYEYSRSLTFLIRKLALDCEYYQLIRE